MRFVRVTRSPTRRGLGSWVLNRRPFSCGGPSGWSAGGRRRLLGLWQAGRHLVSSSRRILCALRWPLRCARLGTPFRTTRTNLWHR